jgi:hypothetical protein
LETAPKRRIMVAEKDQYLTFFVSDFAGMG